MTKLVLKARKRTEDGWKLVFNWGVLKVPAIITRDGIALVLGGPAQVKDLFAAWQRENSDVIEELRRSLT